MAGRPRRLLVPGFCLGLAALAVANILLFLPMALLWVIVARRALPWPRRLLNALPLLLGASLVIAPVTLRNYLIGDDLVLISSNGGINFYLGNNANYEETIRIPPGPAWRALVKPTPNRKPWAYSGLGPIRLFLPPKLGTLSAQSQVLGFCSCSARPIFFGTAKK